MSQIVKAGHYQTESGDIIKFNKDQPLWLALSNKCHDESGLRQLVKQEVKKYDELRGLAYWNKQNREADYQKAITQIFIRLAIAERDAGLSDILFIDQFYEAIKTNQAFYWLSPAHINMAIRKGMQGAYNSEAKLYGNRITIRHLIAWIEAFVINWQASCEVEYTDYKSNQMSQGTERGKTLREFMSEQGM